MSAYLAQLRASALRNQARLDEEARLAREAAHERVLTPLGDRLKKVLSTIPIETQREGLSLSSLRILLRGRQGGNCHCGDLGDALRALKFERHRSYAEGQSRGYAARWYPTR